MKVMAWNTSLWKVDVIIQTFDCGLSSSFIPDLIIAGIPVLLKILTIFFIHIKHKTCRYSIDRQTQYIKC